MKTSDKGIKFIEKEEGIVLHPYKDSRGIPTIGIGSTYWEDGRKVKMTDDPISLERAELLFHTTIKRYEDTVNEAITREINQNQFDALVSLCYNIGTAGFTSSTVVKRVNASPCDPTIADAFKMWKKAGSNLTALLGRRIRESKLYFS
jgi:lysozyme